MAQRGVVGAGGDTAHSDEREVCSEEALWETWQTVNLTEKKICAVSVELKGASFVRGF